MILVPNCLWSSLHSISDKMGDEFGLVDLLHSNCLMFCSNKSLLELWIKYESTLRLFIGISL